MSLDAILKSEIKEAFQNLFGHQLEGKDLGLLPTRKEFEGEFTFVTFPLARYSKNNPEKTAQMLGEELKKKGLKL